MVTWADTQDGYMQLYKKINNRKNCKNFHFKLNLFEFHGGMYKRIRHTASAVQLKIDDAFFIFLLVFFEYIIFRRK